MRIRARPEEQRLYNIRDVCREDLFISLNPKVRASLCFILHCQRALTKGREDSEMALAGRAAGCWAAAVVLATLGAAAAEGGLLDPFAAGHVCGEDGQNYLSKELAHDNGVRALHGGRCGECSNHQDIDIYRRTHASLYKASKSAAFHYLFFGDGASRKKMKAVGLTPGCMDCWMDNIKCDIDSRCLWICLKSTLLRQPRNKPDGSLNDCLQCDEDECGQAFIDCAGANRRRSGIRSDIDRPADQVWEGDEWAASTNNGSTQAAGAHQGSSHMFLQEPSTGSSPAERALASGSAGGSAV